MNDDKEKGRLNAGFSFSVVEVIVIIILAIVVLIFATGDLDLRVVRVVKSKLVPETLVSGEPLYAQ